MRLKTKYVFSNVKVKVLKVHLWYERFKDHDEKLKKMILDSRLISFKDVADNFDILFAK